jgi:hypothetical protein
MDAKSKPARSYIFESDRLRTGVAHAAKYANETAN